MKIVFYSTNSNVYDGENIRTTTFPSFLEQWDFLASKHTDCEFVIATQMPGMFLVDCDKNEILKSKKIAQKILKSDKEKEIAEEIRSLNPDFTFALSFYVAPYDWLSLKDALVADFLRSFGVKTICHPVKTALICFDKWQTHQFFEKIGVNSAKAVYLHHELFINAGNRRETKSNIYRSSIFHEIKKLKFPLIIKDTTGLSSFGSDVVENYEEALGILKSKKTTSDRIIEEMIRGAQFGCEIWGRYGENGGDYDIFPPFMFSTNKYGITSPKQSVKIGPFLECDESQNEKFRLSELKKMLTFLANALRLDGIAQVDLIFDGEKWFVIEINPRLSGMTTTYAASLGVFLSEMVFDKLKIAGENRKENDRISISHEKSRLDRDFFPTVNIKFPILEKSRLEALKSLPYVFFVNQIENHAARQIREQGYCEVILRAETFEKMAENLLDLKNKFSDIAEEMFFSKAFELLETYF